MKTAKVIFDTVHFMLTLALICTVIYLIIELKDAENTIRALSLLYSSLKSGVTIL